MSETQTAECGIYPHDWIDVTCNDGNPPVEMCWRCGKRRNIVCADDAPTRLQEADALLQRADEIIEILLGDGEHKGASKWCGDLTDYFNKYDEEQP